MGFGQILYIKVFSYLLFLEAYVTLCELISSDCRKALKRKVHYFPKEDEKERTAFIGNDEPHQTILKS